MTARVTERPSVADAGDVGCRHYAVYPDDYHIEELRGKIIKRTKQCPGNGQVVRCPNAIEQYSINPKWIERAGKIGEVFREFCEVEANAVWHPKLCIRCTGRSP